MIAPEVNTLIAEYVKWSCTGKSVVHLGFPNKTPGMADASPSRAGCFISDEIAGAVWGALLDMRDIYPEQFDIANHYWGLEGSVLGKGKPTDWLVAHGHGNPHQVFKKLEAVRTFVSGHMIQAGFKTYLLQLRGALDSNRKS